MSATKRSPEAIRLSVPAATPRHVVPVQFARNSALNRFSRAQPRAEKVLRRSCRLSAAAEGSRPRPQRWHLDQHVSSTHAVDTKSLHLLSCSCPPTILPPLPPRRSHSWLCSHTQSLPINCMVFLIDGNMRVLRSFCTGHIDVIPLERLALLAAAGTCSTSMGGGRSRATRNLLFLADVVRVLLSWVLDAR